MRFAVFFFYLSLLVIGVQDASAHAFLDHAEPAVGSSLKIAPKTVQIWFTERLEPAFCRLSVLNAAGAKIDKGDLHLDQSSPNVLIVSLPDLNPGTFKVMWIAVSVDTHRTTGSFTFQVLPSGPDSR